MSYVDKNFKIFNGKITQILGLKLEVLTF